MTIVRVGTTKKFSDGWETAFGKGKKKSAATAVAKKSKPSKTKKSATKKAATKKTVSKKTTAKKAAKKRPAAKSKRK